jgi:hypothetical protein
MSLVTLPTEIISRVCRFLGLLVGEEYDFPQYDNASLKALRLTCRELCDKTTYDAAIRYGLQLENLEIRLTYKELCWLLHISKTPTLCDNINTVYLYTKDYEQRSDICLHTEETFDMYFASSDCIHILAECFRNLSRGKRLTQVKAGTTKIHCTVFQALDLAQFNRRIMGITSKPQYILDARYRELQTNLLLMHYTSQALHSFRPERSSWAGRCLDPIVARVTAKDTIRESTGSISPRC